MKTYFDACKRRSFLGFAALSACIAGGNGTPLAKERDSILIKPHHFIALFRDLGEGSDPGRYTNGNDYKHAYDMVMNNHSLRVISTVGVDFICGPCKYLKDGKCTARISGHGPEQPLQEWAQRIDTRLLRAMNIREGDSMTARQLAEWCRENLGSLDTVFMEESEENRISRALSMHIGLNKYLSHRSMKEGRLVQ